MKQIKKTAHVLQVLPEDISKQIGDSASNVDLWAIATTQSPDSVGDVIIVDGMAVEPYHLPPNRYIKILPSHNLDALPLGRIEVFAKSVVEVDGSLVPALIFGMSWAKDGQGNLDPTAARYKGLYDGG